MAEGVLPIEDPNADQLEKSGLADLRDLGIDFSLGNTPVAVDTGGMQQVPQDALSGLGVDFSRPIPVRPENPPGTVVSRAAGRGTRSSMIALRALVDPEGAQVALEKLYRENPPAVAGLRDVDGVGSALVFGAEKISESLPEMIGVTLVAAGTLATGGALPATLAVLAASTSFNSGRNLIRQLEDTGEVDYRTALGYGTAQGALDAILPGRASGVFKTRLMGAVNDVAKRTASNAARRVGEDVATEAATEGVQTFLEQLAGTPENVRILFDPKTPEEMKKSDELLWELAEATITGGVVGGAFSTGAETVSSIRNRRSVTTSPPGPSGAAQGEDYFDRLAQRESGGNPNAQARGSSAGGLYQFIDSTWVNTVRKHMPDVADGRTDQELIALKNDPALQDRAVRRFTADNASELSRMGLPVNGTTLYAAHHFGTGGARKLFRADANASAEAVLGSDVIAANPYMRGMTVGQVIANLENDFGASAIPVNRGNPLAGIRTATNKAGTPLPAQEPNAQRNALAEQFRKIFDTTGDTSDTMPTSSVDALSSQLLNERQSNPIASMLAIAGGTVEVNGLSKSESMEIAQQTLRAFGYDPQAMRGKSIADIQAMQPSFAVAGTDLATAPLSDVLQTQTQRTTATSMVNSAYKQALNSTADMMAKLSSRIVDAYTAGAVTARDDKGRSIPAEYSGDGAADAAAVAELTEVLTKGSTDAAAAQRAAAALPAVERMFGDRVSKELEALLRTYQSPEDAGDTRRSTPAAFRDAFQRLAQALEAVNAVPAFQRDYGKPTAKGFRKKVVVPTPRFGELRGRIYAAEERERRTIRETAKARKLAALNRETIRQEDAAREKQRASRQANLETRALADYLATIADSGVPDPGVPAAVAQNTVRAAISPITQPTGQSRLNRFLSGVASGVGGAARDTGRPLMLFAMTQRQISESYGRTLHKVRWQHRKTDFVTALRLAFESGNEQGEDVKNRFHALADRTYDMGRERMQALASVANDATNYEAHMLHPTTDAEFTATEFAESLMSEAAYRDAKGLKPTDSVPAHVGVNAHIPEPRHARVKTIHGAHRKLDADQKKVYLDARREFKRTREAQFDLLITNLVQQDEHLGPNAEIRSIKDANAAISAGRIGPETAQAIKDLRTVSRLRGDYFPLARNDGEFSVYARKAQRFTGATPKDAIDRAKAAMATSPYLQSSLKVLDENPPPGKPFEVEGYYEFYKIVGSDRRAQEETNLLVSQGADLGAGQYLKFDEGEIRYGRRHVDLLEGRGLPQGTIDLLRSKLIDSPDAKGGSAAAIDALNQLQFAQMKRLVTVQRDNVLGATTNLADVFKRYGTRASVTTRELAASPSVTRVNREVRTAIESMSGTGKNINQTVMNHMNKLRDIRQEFYSPSKLRQMGSRLTQFSVIWYLSSMSYFALNLSQPFIYGMPFFAGKYGARSVRTYTANIGSALSLVSRSGASGVVTPGARARLGDVELRDPANPTAVLDGVATTTYDPITKEPVYLHNTRLEYDRYERGEISFDRLRFYSESRKRGAFGETFFERPPEGPVPEPEAEGAAGAVRDAAGKTLDWTADKVSYLAEHIEYANRLAVIDTVYDMHATQRSGDGPLSASALQDVVSAADDLNYRINVDYSQGNRSALQLKAGPFLLFASFGWHFMYQTWRMFRSATIDRATDGNASFTRGQGTVTFMGLFMTHFLTSGLTGGIPQWMILPGQLTNMATFGGAQSVLSAMFAELFGLEEGEDPEDLFYEIDRVGLLNYFKSWTRRHMGDTAADTLFEGLPSAVLGVDLTGRISLAEGYTFAELDKLFTNEDDFMAQAFTLLGPVPGIFLQGVRGADKVRTKGADFTDWLEYFAPIKAVRDVAKAVNQQDIGLTTKNGVPVVTAEHFDMVDALWQGVGFTPETVGDAYRRRDIDYGYRTKLRTERDAVLARWRLAQSAAERREVRSRVREFNRTAPYDFRIKASTLNDARMNVMEAARETSATGGVQRQSQSSIRSIMDIEGAP